MSKVFRVWFKWTMYRNVNAHCLHVNASNKGEAYGKNVKVREVKHLWIG